MLHYKKALASMLAQSLIIAIHVFVFLLKIFM